MNLGKGDKSVEKVLILGSGKFGRRAVMALQGKNRLVTIADQCLAALPEPTSNLALIYGDAIDVLCQAGSQYTWVVPAIPIHVALAWLLAQFGAEGIDYEEVDVPADFQVPNPFRINKTLYASFASHLCPEDCSEPSGTCYLTGEEREQPLHQVLQGQTSDRYEVEVILSHQLAPGVGGIRMLDLHDLFNRLRRRKGRVVLATSCSCHAVIDSFRIK